MRFCSNYTMPGGYLDETPTPLLRGLCPSQLKVLHSTFAFRVGEDCPSSEPKQAKATASGDSTSFEFEGYPKAP